MTKKEILKYSVIEQSKEAKRDFNKILKRPDVKLTGTFLNEYNELFVVYEYGFNDLSNIFPQFSEIYSITGDEFGWETGWVIGKDYRVYKPFELTYDEFKSLTNLFIKNKHD